MVDPRAVSLQYDLGVSSVSLSDKLLELIRAASQDNTQPQAVLALRAIGSLIHPSPELIGKAVNALGGSDNVRIEHMKLVIGLEYGGTATFLRQSTPGISGFLLICALKLAHHDIDIGEVLYQMTIASNVLGKWPTSSQQLAQLTSTLAGNACTILPVDHLNRISSSILCNGPGVLSHSRMIEPLSTFTLARLLVSIFECLRDDEVSKVVVEGHTSASWIATILTWLMPEETVVTFGESVIYPCFDPKLVIRINDLPIETVRASDSWILERWRKDRCIQDFIEVRNTQASIPYRHCLRRNYKYFIQSRFELDSRTIKTFGACTGALHCLLMERGRLALKITEEGRWLCANLLDVATDYCFREYSHVMRQYGWTTEDLATQTQVYESLTAWLSDCGGLQHLLSTHNMLTVVKQWVLERINNSEQQLWRCVPDILDLVDDSLVFLCLKGNAELDVPTIANLGRGRQIDVNSILQDLLSPQGFHVREFMVEAYTKLCPYQSEYRSNGLIIAGNGIVVWPSIICEPQCERRAALALKLTPGHLRRENERFSSIREIATLTPNNLSLQVLGVANPFNNDTFLGLAPIADHRQSNLFVHTTTQGSTLLVNSHMILGGSKSTHRRGLTTNDQSHLSTTLERSFSWLNARDYLACSIHIDTSDLMTSVGEEKLARRIWKDPARGLDNLPQWIPSDSCRQPPCKGAFLARTWGDVLMTLYQLSVPGQVMVLAHGTSLIKAVSLAYEHGDSWCILP